MTPEAKARVDIDKLLAQAGWHVCGMGDFNIHAAEGVAIREFPLNTLALPTTIDVQQVGVVICTIQRMFSMLKGRELPPEADEESTEGLENLFKEPEPIGYNAGIPIDAAACAQHVRHPAGIDWQRRAGTRRRRLPFLAGLCVQCPQHRRGVGPQRQWARRMEGCAGADAEGVAGDGGRGVATGRTGAN